MRLETLKRRDEFQRVRGGGRWSTPGFVVEGKARGDTPSGIGDGSTEGAISTGARFGFTITRKVGGAVVRNRIRRRLRSAIAQLAAAHARADYDYVVIARTAAFDRPFQDIEQDLITAFVRVHAPPRQGNRRGPHRAKQDETR